MKDYPDKFQNTHGIARVRDPFNEKPGGGGEEWSDKRVAIGASTEKNILELNEYKLVLKHLGLFELIQEARDAVAPNENPIALAEYLTQEKGFRWTIEK